MTRVTQLILAVAVTVLAAQVAEAAGIIRRAHFKEKIAEEFDESIHEASLVTVSTTAPTNQSVTLTVSRDGRGTLLTGKTDHFIRAVDGDVPWTGDAGDLDIAGRYVSADGSTQSFKTVAPWCTRNCAWVESRQPDGVRLRTRVTAAKAKGTPYLKVELEAVIITSMAPVGGFDVTLSGRGATAHVKLAKSSTGEDYRTEWAFPALTNDSAETTFDAVATLSEKTSEGIVTLDEMKQPVFLGAHAKAHVNSARLETEDNGLKKLHLTTWAQGESPVGILRADVDDAELLSVVASKATSEPNQTVTILSARGIPHFWDDWQGEVMATITREDGVQTSFALLLDGKAHDVGGDFHKAMATKEKDGTWTVSLSIRSSGFGEFLVKSYSIQMDRSIAPIGGDPTVKPVVADLALDGQFRTWVLPFRDPAGEASTYGAGVRWTADDGVTVLDGWWLDIQAQLGIGTRSTASQAKTKAELL